MTFLHPGYLYAGAIAAAALAALHFIVAEQPRAGILPTVRFFPDVQVRATSLTARLSDLPLLALRMLVVALIAAALAQPQLNRARIAVRRIVALDLSRDVARAKEVRDSAARYVDGAASVIVFDSTATEAAAPSIVNALSGVRREGGGARRGSLSSALIVALRAASRLRATADSFDLVLVSPLRAEEADSATAAIRRLWPGRIRLARVAGAGETTRSAAAAVEWTDSSASARWARREHPDTIGGVMFRGGLVVHPFVRRWRVARADTAEKIVGRWIDGEPAVLERKTGAGCARSVSVPLPTVGDAALRPSFTRFFESVYGPCAAEQSFLPMSAAALAELQGGQRLAAASAFPPEATRVAPLVPLLLGAAIAAALVELVVRAARERRQRRRDSQDALPFSDEFRAEMSA